MKFFPCIADSTGRIAERLSDKPMTQKEAEDFLKLHHPDKWRRCEAIPQPEGHHYFARGGEASTSTELPHATRTRKP